MTVAQAVAKPEPQPISEIERALALHQQGRFDDAEQICGALLAARPDHPDALHLLALVRHQQGRNVEALQLVGALLRRTSPSAEIFNNLGLILTALGRHEQALAFFEDALVLATDHFGARKNRADCLKRLARYEQALAAYEAVLAINPDALDALNECGGLHTRLGRPAAAIACYEKALAIAPRTVELLINKGTAFAALKRFDEALDSFAAAAAIDPERAEAHYNAGIVRLRLGDFAHGWRGYEWRWRKADWSRSRRNFAAPLWLGAEPLPGKTILLHAEQGFGDTIQFVRYVPLVARHGAKVILECQPQLKRLLQNVEGASFVFARGEDLPNFDLHCPLLSLPLAFGTELATVPGDIPYLRARQHDVTEWRQRLLPKGRLRVGLCWAGNSTHLNDRNRSIPLERFARLLSVPNLDFISVQKEVSETQAATLREHGVMELGREFADFADTAAMVAMLDLLVTVDTSVAHLAGAMGKAVALLVAFSPDSRWLLNRTDSPWYPTMRLFRQAALGDWDGPIERVRQELIEVSRRSAKSG
jgi:tetratricopeptide (TPR) repeat protein